MCGYRHRLDGVLRRVRPESCKIRVRDAFYQAHHIEYQGQRLFGGLRVDIFRSIPESSADTDYYTYVRVDSFPAIDSYMHCIMNIVIVSVAANLYRKYR